MSGIALRTRRFDRALLGAPAWAGCVEAVHPHAIVVRVEGAPGLVVVVDGSRGLVPNGIEAGGLSCDRDEQVWFDRLTLSLGKRWAVALDGEGVDLVVRPDGFSAGAVRSVLWLDLPPRTRRLLEEPATSETGTDAAALDAARVVAALLAHAVAHGTRRAGEVELLVGRLAGLGAGSTPTGDDVLAGLAAAGHRLAPTKGVDSKAWADLLAALDGLPSGATTAPGWEMLRHAARGAFAEPLCELVRLMGSQGEGRRLEVAAGNLASLGAHSGSEMLAGVVLLVRAAVGRNS